MTDNKINYNSYEAQIESCLAGARDASSPDLAIKFLTDAENIVDSIQPPDTMPVREEGYGYISRFMDSIRDAKKALEASR